MTKAKQPDFTCPTEAPPLLPPGQLDEAAAAFGTDKSSLDHDYMRLYEFVFAPFRQRRFTLLELGVGQPDRRAPSMRTWKKYFTKAHIVGVDNKPVCKAFEEERINIEIGNASQPAYLKSVFDKWNPSIVIDDASHIWSHQITAFKTLFPMLPPNGIYVIEDIHTSFGNHRENPRYADQAESCWDFVAKMQCALACNQHKGPEITAEETFLVAWTDAVFLTRKTVVFVKRASPSVQETRKFNRKLAQEGKNARN